MLMDDWVRSVTAIPHDERPFPEALARRHVAFEQIHPFLDGNGRTGRLLLNLILIRMGYPPAIMYKRDRLRYLRALRRGDRGDVGPLGEFVARNVLDTLHRFIGTIRAQSTVVVDKNPSQRSSVPIGFAHRGAPRTRAEQNTLPAFERALVLGARALETDIGLTADGEPVLLHPRILLRRGPDVARLRRHELPPSIPTLEDLYRRCGTDFDLALDMAQPRAVDAVVRVAEEHGAEGRLWLTYWRLPVLADWRRRWPHLKLVYATIPTRPGGAAVVEHLADMGIDAINVFHLLCTNRLVESAHARDLRIFAWGVRSRRPLERVLTHGVDGVFCDDVEAMVRVIQE